MRRIALAAFFALGATAGQADIAPVFLPDLTFPDPAPAPTVPTRNCETDPRCTR